MPRRRDQGASRETPLSEGAGEGRLRSRGGWEAFCARPRAGVGRGGVAAATRRLFAPGIVFGLAHGSARSTKFGFGPEVGLALQGLRVRFVVDRLLRPLAVTGFRAQTRGGIDVAREFVVLGF